MCFGTFKRERPIMRRIKTLNVSFWFCVSSGPSARGYSKSNPSLRFSFRYSQIDGIPELKELTQKLIFGKASKRIASCQCLSGTGALRICAEFVYKHLREQIPYGKIYYSDQTWGNHPAIFRAAGLTPEAHAVTTKKTLGMGNHPAYRYRIHEGT